jgi:hypothetical protein
VHGVVNLQRLVVHLAVVDANAAPQRGHRLEQRRVLGGGVFLLGPRRAELGELGDGQRRDVRRESAAPAYLAQDHRQRQSQRASLRAVRRGLGHLIQHEPHHGHRRVARLLPGGDGTVSAPLPQRSSLERLEPRLPHVRGAEHLEQRRRRGLDVPRRDERGDRLVRALVHEQARVSRLDARAFETIVPEVPILRGMHGVVQHLVGERLAPPDARWWRPREARRWRSPGSPPRRPTCLACRPRRTGAIGGASRARSPPPPRTDGERAPRQPRESEPREPASAARCSPRSARAETPSTSTPATHGAAPWRAPSSPRLCV